MRWLQDIGVGMQQSVEILKALYFRQIFHSGFEHRRVDCRSRSIVRILGRLRSEGKDDQS